MRVPRSFYARGVEEVARDLLGCHLVHGGRTGRIVEVEAYGGPGDPGSHAHRAPNGRARIMFGPPGKAYVYFTYGMHYCMNVVADAPGLASAVLIRAIEPLRGIEAMRAACPTPLPDHKLASGPGRLCRALGIGRELNGSDVVRGPIVVKTGDAPLEVHAGPRVGLSDDDGREWRFWSSSPAVSGGFGGRSERAAAGSFHDEAGKQRERT